MLNLSVIPSFLRGLLWRLGRNMYTSARGDRSNDPTVNGEYWLLRKVMLGSAGQKIMIDVGANKGNWTAAVLELATDKSTITIHAFEPSRNTREFLANRFQDFPQVKVHPFALSDSPGEAEFFCSEPCAGTNSLSPESGKNIEKVEKTTIDKFIELTHIENISQIKIDTEGFDMLVLKGAEKTLSEGRVDFIQFEYNWRWQLNRTSLRDVFSFIYGKPYLFGKLVGEEIEFYSEWHFELDRYFENNYVLMKKGINQKKFGKSMFFNKFNVAVPVIPITSAGVIGGAR